MRISDWSSDVCSSDLEPGAQAASGAGASPGAGAPVAPSAPPVAPPVAPPAGSEPVVPAGPVGRAVSSEERRVGNGCSSACITRWSPDRSKETARDLAREATHSGLYDLKGRQRV